MVKDPRCVSRGCEWPACRDGWLCGEPIAGLDANGRLACDEHLAQDPPLAVVDQSKRGLMAGRKTNRQQRSRQAINPSQDREAIRPLLKRVPAPGLPELARHVFEPAWLVHTDRAFCRYAVRAGTDRGRRCRRTPVTILDGFPFCAVHTQILRETVPVRSMSAYMRQGLDIDAAWAARAEAAEREDRFLGPKESMQALRKMTGSAKLAPLTRKKS